MEKKFLIHKINLAGHKKVYVPLGLQEDTTHYILVLKVQAFS